MELTPEEIKLIEEYREKQELAKPKFMGFLKEDLYLCDENMLYFVGEAVNNQFVTKQQMEETISSIKDCFKLSIKAGSNFICYTNIYGKQEWYDQKGYIEGYSNDWAEENLENIEKYED